jgi:hypothetical protein
MSLREYTAQLPEILCGVAAAVQLGAWTWPLIRKGWRSVQSHTKPKQDLFLTTPEVAEKCGISVAQARRTCERGFFLDYVWVGRQRAIRVQDLEKFRQAAKEAGYSSKER